MTLKRIKCAHWHILIFKHLWMCSSIRIDFEAHWRSLFKHIYPEMCSLKNIDLETHWIMFWRSHWPWNTLNVFRCYFYSCSLWFYSDALREAQGSNKDLSRQVQELLSIRGQLESERDRLASELGDTLDALRDAQSRADGANASLNQLRSDFELRLHQKDEELENIR